MEAAIHLHAVLLAVLMFMSGMLFMSAPRIYQWARNAHWVYLPWYRSPESESFRAWALRSRPRLERFCADASTTFLLFAACKFIVVLTLAVQQVFPTT